MLLFHVVKDSKEAAFYQFSITCHKLENLVAGFRYDISVSG